MSIVSRANVYSAIYTFINATLGISVFEGEAPQNEALPVAVYTGVGDVPTFDMGTEHLDIDIQVNFFGEKKLGVAVLRAYADTLITALDDGGISITGYSNEIVFVTNAGVTTVEDDILNIRIEFNLLGS